MKETCNTIVAIMTLANGKKYVTTCEYGTDAYDNLKDTIYKSASLELRQAMNEGCDIEAYSVCPAKNAEELKNMLIYRYATDREQFGYNNISMSSATNGHPKGETHYKAKSVTLKDTLNNKTVTYPTIQALADAIGRKYSTVHKYLKQQELLDGRYLIKYAEEQSTEVPETNIQEDMTLDVSEIVVTSSRKRPVIIEDIISHKKAHYESIAAVAKALNSKYITIFKYINNQRLVNKRYRITYAD